MSGNASATAAAGNSGSTSNAHVPPPTPSSATTPQNQNLNAIVIEYLSKKGYSRTEAMLRLESSSVDSEGRPVPDPKTKVTYEKAYNLIKGWIEDSLDLYKPELRRLLFPIFVHSYLTLVKEGHTEGAKSFFDKNSKDFESTHSYDLRALSAISTPLHVEEDETSKLYRENKYTVVLTNTTNNLLMHFLSEYSRQGGEAIVNILNTNVQINKVDKTPSFGFINDDDTLGESEGITGHVNKDKPTQKNLPGVKLGLLPMDKDLMTDVEEELAAEDAREKELRKEEDLGASSGSSTLVQTFQQIKREESEDTPMRDDLPLPPYKQADIDSEVKAVKDYRDRYRLSTLATTAATQPGLEGPPMGGALPSVVMYTFHSTNDNLHCLSFSSDTSLCAGGFAESYVRIWSLRGEKLYSTNASDNNDVSTTRRYIGHSGPVYNTSFSPDASHLLSCSEDKSVRLWSLQTHTALVSYKGHDSPVWDVAWGPFGHYFATGSHDNTARLWSTEHIAPLRIFAGHLSDVDVVGWHPNSAYVITGSSDKTLRMWDIQQGDAVRLFNGHTAPITCLAVSPNGKYIASGDTEGTIIIWSIGSQKRVKTMRGHGKVPIYSISWSMEGQVLVTGGADNTVRVWSVIEDKGSSTSGTVGAEIVINGIGGIGPGDGTTKVDVTAGGAGGLGVLGAKGRRDKKEVVATPDHLAVYYTKKTPVYKVHFTKKNLVLAGGAFLP